MAADALAAYRADLAYGKDALLVCDTKEMADALNQRVHDETIDAAAPTVTAARGHHVGVGDVIISRRNDPTLGVFDAIDIHTPADPVRNGQRWQVYAVDTDNNRIAARRLDDGGRTAFSGDYLRQHITHGDAITVHSAPGRHRRHHARRARRTHQPRPALRRFDPRPRHQPAFLYERVAGEGDHEHAEQPGVHVLRRGTSREVAILMRGILANRDDRAGTAHDIAAHTEDRAQLPDRVRRLLAQRAAAVQRRRAAYRHRCEDITEAALEHHQAIEQHREHGREHGMDYGLEL